MISCANFSTPNNPTFIVGYQIFTYLFSKIHTYLDISRKNILSFASMQLSAISTPIFRLFTTLALRMSIYFYTFDFDTFENDTFKSVIFRFSQK